MAQGETPQDSQRYWLRAGFFTLSEKALALLFNLGSAMLLLRLLPKESFAAWGIFVLLGYFVEMGRSGLLQNGLVRSLALRQHDRQAQAATGMAAWALNAAYSLLAGLLLWAAADGLAAQYGTPQLAALLRLYLPLCLLQAPYAQFGFVAQAHLEFRGLFWGTFFYRGALFAWVAFCWLAQRPIALPELLVALMLGQVAGTAASWFFARPHLHALQKIDFQEVKDLLGYGKYVLGTNLSTMFYKNIDKLSLGQLLGPAAFAVYDAAGRVTQMIETPSFSIAAVVFPKSAERMAAEGPQAVKELYERSVAAILAIILPFLLGVLLFAEPIIALFAGPQYADAAGVLRLTAFFGLFLPFAVQFGTVLDSAGKPQVNLAYTLATALLNLVLSVVLIPRFGLFGAAYATLGGYALSFALTQHYLHKHFNINALNAFRFVPDCYGVLWRLVGVRR
jgi:O-antigen/teichoic acid export membrane protein